MDMGEAVIVAGFGFRRGASGAEIVAALDAALARCARTRQAVAALATSLEKSIETGMAEAGQELGLDVLAVDAGKLKAVVARTLTRSERSLAATGLPSVSEAAALAAAGDGARLLGARLAVGSVTCALAEVAR